MNITVQGRRLRIRTVFCIVCAISVTFSIMLMRQMKITENGMQERIHDDMIDERNEVILEKTEEKIVVHGDKVEEREVLMIDKDEVREIVQDTSRPIFFLSRVIGNTLPPRYK